MLDLASIDPALHQRLTSDIRLRTGLDGWPHHPECHARGDETVTLPFLELLTTIDACCEDLVDDELDVPRGTAAAVQALVKFGARTSTKPSRISTDRLTVERISNDSPHLQLLTSAVMTHIEERQLRLQRWSEREGDEALELLATFHGLDYLEGHTDLWQRIGLVFEVAEPLSVNELKDAANNARELAAVEALLRRHRERPRPEGDLFLWTPSILGLFGAGEYHQVALERHAVSPNRAYRLPCSLVSLVTHAARYDSTGITWSRLKPSDDAAVLETAVVLINDGMRTATEALEIARAL